MEVLPVDIVSLVAVILGISIVLVPVIGLTARFALKPVVEALARVVEERRDLARDVRRRLPAVGEQTEKNRPLERCATARGRHA